VPTWLGVGFLKQPHACQHSPGSYTGGSNERGRESFLAAWSTATTRSTTVPRLTACAVLQAESRLKKRAVAAAICLF
jgi:hypothetical protein